MKTVLCLALCLVIAPVAAQYSGSYGCTEDCSGHEAGHDWAEQRGIADPDDCDGKSESFVEGCRDYAEQQQEEAEYVDEDGDECDPDDGDECLPEDEW